ncbi:MAG: ABC transporter ATP-binding protein [Burkholderiales bacterium]|nr:MAG: ABC transporter ATP-binding protein [Burkholderiales bacterium]
MRSCLCQLPPEPPMAGVELDDLHLSLGGNPVLSGVSLRVEDGECLALLGPSGCGKTTTLRAIAGFVRPSRGSVRIRGEPIDAQPPHRRNLGLVFQDYALFPHMTAAQNVGYGLRMRGMPRGQIREAVARALALVRLDGLDERYPAEMSGGQRQRVALARAIVIEPHVLLLDEPLGALDRKLRDEMQVELKRLHRDLGITTIIVTHDQEEALSLSDRVAVMFRGRIAAVAAPTELYRRPHREDVMAFLGRANFFDARRQAHGASGHHATAFGAAIDLGARAGTRASLRVGIRPEHVEVRPGEPEAGSGEFAAVIVDIIYRGSSAELLLQAGEGQRISADAPATAMSLQSGDSVAVRLPADHCVVFDERST